MKKKRKQHPPQGDDANTVPAATCRVERGEQGEARPAINVPRSGPRLDLGRLRLKTWSKSDFWIAEITCIGLGWGVPACFVLPTPPHSVPGLVWVIWLFYCGPGHVF